MAFVQAVSNQLGGVSTITVTLTTTVGNLLIVGSGDGGNTSHSYADDKGNTYTLLGGTPVSTTTKGFKLFGARAPVTTGGSTVVTATLPGSEYPWLVVAEYSGVDTSVLDAIGTGFSDLTNTTSHTGASVTSITTGADIVCINTIDLQGGAVETVTPGNSFVVPSGGSKLDSGIGVIGFLAHRLNQAIGAYTGAFTTGNSDQAASLAFALKPAAVSDTLMAQICL